MPIPHPRPHARPVSSPTSLDANFFNDLRQAIPIDVFHGDPTIRPALTGVQQADNPMVANREHRGHGRDKALPLLIVRCDLRIENFQSDLFIGILVARQEHHSDCPTPMIESSW
jgi:hypothetical protein